MNIIFDWSGTLADDQKITWKITNETLTHFGAGPVTFAVYQKEFTIPVSGFYTRYLPDTSIQQVDTVFFQKLHHYLDEIKLFEGFPSFIRNIANRHSLFILSTLDNEILDRLLKNMDLTSCFKGVYGNAFEKTGVLQSLISRHNLIKNDSLLIGDMPHDIEAARACRLPAAAVTYGYTARMGFKGTRPDFYFDNPRDILEHLEKLSQTETLKWPVVTAGGLVFKDDGRALLIKTSKWSGLLGTPGGKVDYGETLHQAFAREIHEETNLSVKDIRFVFYQDCIEHTEFYKPVHFLLMNYIARFDHGDVILNYESEDYRWATLAEMKDLDLNEPTKNLVHELIHRKAEFSQWTQ